MIKTTPFRMVFIIRENMKKNLVLVMSVLAALAVCILGFFISQNKKKSLTALETLQDNLNQVHTEIETLQTKTEEIEENQASVNSTIAEIQETQIHYQETVSQAIAQKEQEWAAEDKAEEQRKAEEQAAKEKAQQDAANQQSSSSGQQGAASQQAPKKQEKLSDYKPGELTLKEWKEKGFGTNREFLEWTNGKKMVSGGGVDFEMTIPRD